MIPARTVAIGRDIVLWGGWSRPEARRRAAQPTTVGTDLRSVRPAPHGRAVGRIAEVVNRVKPGSGSFVALDGIDHAFLRAAPEEESYRLFKPAPGAKAGEFNPVILETLGGWLDETTGRPEAPPRP